MKTMQKIIHAGFAMCALASASMPALSWTVWPNIDFEWYAADTRQWEPARSIADDYPHSATPDPISSSRR